MMIVGFIGAALIVWAMITVPRRHRSGVFIKHQTVRMKAYKGRLVSFDVIESEREL